MILRCAGWELIVLALLLGLAVPGLARPARKPRQRGPREMVDVNAASAEKLATVPGLGRHLAHAVVASRNQLGDFQTPEDLARVKGIGPVNLVRIARYLTFPEGGLAAAAVPGTP